jgi:hypothetical protein
MRPPGAVPLTTRIIGISEPIRQCARHHRHLPRCAGGLFGVEVVRSDTRWPCAWGIVGRPSSRHLDADGWWELVRGIVPEGAPPGCASAVLAAAARAARDHTLPLYGPGHAPAPGGALRRLPRTAPDPRPIVTYTLASEPGTSLIAAGWVPAGTTGGGQWGNDKRPRDVRSGELAAPKRRWVSRWSVDAARARGWVE